MALCFLGELGHYADVLLVDSVQFHITLVSMDLMERARAIQRVGFSAKMTQSCASDL
jgi:hypothetical protein